MYFVKNQSTMIASKLTDSTREVLGTHFQILTLLLGEMNMGPTTLSGTHFQSVIR